MNPVRCLALLVLVTLGCTPTAAPAQPVAVSQSAPTPESVIAHLKAAGLPITSDIVYTAETDPNKLLGRPSQYTAKASWKDPRVDDPLKSDEPGIWTGGTVEIFATDADRQTFQTYVAEMAKTPLLAHYGYARGRVLLRVAGRLTPDQAAEYDRALQTLP